MPKLQISARGAIRELFHARDPRILLEGPANTGKSTGVLRWLEWHAWMHPGIRVLLCRQTMQSLRESIMVSLEDKVWGPMCLEAGWRKHPAHSGNASRATRRIYQYPDTPEGLPGTTYVLGGLEDPGWTFSMEYDLIAVFEAWQVGKDSLEKLYRANRNHVLCRYDERNAELARLVQGNWQDERWMRGHRCWQQIVCDTNPSSEFHPLNLIAAPLGGEELDRIRDDQAPSRRVFRSSSHQFTRILSRHEDNPACTEDDLARLRALTGPRYANLYLGLWQSAEGRVWPTWDPTLHMLNIALERDEEDVADPDAAVDTRPLYLRFLGDRPGCLTDERAQVKWTFASMDFGFHNATCLQVWAVDNDDRIYRIVEVYRRQVIDDWFAEKLVELYQEFDLHAVVADCADPNRIQKLNDRLQGYRGRKGARIVRGVNKALRRGGRTTFIGTKLDLVRDMIEPSQEGGPRMFWKRDALRYGRCPVSTEGLRPACSEEEILSYVYAPHEDGKPDKETPDPGCAQDGCDATSYAAVYFWLMRPGFTVAPEEAILPGTAGDRMGHAAVLRGSRDRWR